MSTIQAAPPHRNFSYSRVFSLLFPVLIIAVGIAAYSNRIEKKAIEELERTTLWHLLGKQQEMPTLASQYRDTNDDYVADLPTNVAELQRPSKLRFSYISQSDSNKGKEAWQEFMAAVAEKTHCEVELVAFDSLEAQTEAMRSGDLQLTAFGTGEVETAVTQAGFVPLACFANERGEYGYKMQFIVPATSKIQKIEDLKGHRLTLTRPKSNSGCIAPLVLLSNDFGMELDRDYDWGMSQSHENSIRGVVTGQYEVAAVASDILDNMIASDTSITEDSFRVIYESKSYPPGVFGVPHNLDPEIVEALREVFFSFDWMGTGLEANYGGDGSVQFAMVSYKNDWEPVRRLRQAAIEIANRVAPTASTAALK